MTFYIRQLGSWKEVKTLHIRQNNIWVPAKAAYVRENGAWFQYYTAEKVVVLANSVSPIIKNYFTAAEWANPYLRKIVEVPTGVEIGANFSGHALATSDSASGQSGSWAGELIVNIRGIVSGIGGTITDGTGGTAFLATYPGRNNERAQVNLLGGTIRAGGGVGGRGGNGGAGNYLVETFSGWQYQWRDIYNVSRNPAGTTNQYFWNGTAVYTGGDDTGSVIVGSYRYVRGTYQRDFSGWSIYQIGRYTRTFPATTGGVAGNAGRGQGFDGAATTGAAPVAGGTNAGASGKSGDGGTWGQPGQAGATGANGNVGSGSAGTPGGLAGLAINGNANILFTNTSGILQGRIA